MKPLFSVSKSPNGYQVKFSGSERDTVMIMAALVRIMEKYSGRSGVIAAVIAAMETPFDVREYEEDEHGAENGNKSNA